MSAIENCRTAALGGHVAACTKCGHRHVAYNSCRNRHCPKCQGAASREWMQARIEDLLPVEYFHVVFTLPAQIADMACQNKAAVYGLPFKASAKTLLTIAADPRHLGSRIGMTSVLHTWGSAMTHQTKLSKYGNARLRRTFWMAGQVAIMQRANSFRDKFERYIAKDRHNADLRRKASTAIATKMARTAYAIVKGGEPYRPFFEGTIHSGRTIL